MNAGLTATGGSIGFDAVLPEGLLWRTELRVFRASERVFPRADRSTASRTNTVLVMSFALTL
jgi:hypothetical protein